MISRRVVAKIPSEEEMFSYAERSAKTFRGGEVLLLSGPLGAGKTVFARGLAKGFGVRDRVTSPTFVVMRVHGARHRSIRHLVHVDAYRIRDAHELETIGLTEWVGRPDTIIVIEWGERVRQMFRRVPCVVIRIDVRAGDARAVTITPRRKTSRTK